MAQLVNVHTVNVNEKKGKALVAVAQLGRSKTFHIQRIAAAPVAKGLAGLAGAMAPELWRSANGTRFQRFPGSSFQLY